MMDAGNDALSVGNTSKNVYCKFGLQRVVNNGKYRKFIGRTLKLRRILSTSDFQAATLRLSSIRWRNQETALRLLSLSTFL